MLFSALILGLASADDALHLLQMHAHVHSATQPKPVEPVPENAKVPQYPLKKKHPKFGPDGTWATPYCKSVLGCTPYCPDGCNGTAYWEASYGPPGLGAVDRADYDPNNPGAHFLTCAQGENRGHPPIHDYKIKVHGGNVNCLNSENAGKKSFWSKTKPSTAWKDEMKIAWGTNDNGVSKSWNSGGWIGDGEGWGNEFCPESCVNDCAQFKLGGFLSCGIHLGRGWTGYNGATTNAVGPNYYCPQNVVSGTGHQSWTWCGEKVVRCKKSAATKKKIADAKAAKRAKKAAKKAARQEFQDAKDALEQVLAEAETQCE